MRFARICLAVLLFLIVSVVTFDYIYDRTPLSNRLITDATKDYPFTLTLGHVEHKLLRPGYLELKDVKWQDEFGNSAQLDSLIFALNWRALFWGRIEVEQVNLSGLTLNASQQGLAQLQANLPAGEDTTQPEDAVESNDSFFSVAKLNQLTISPFNLSFTTDTQSVALKNAHIELQQWQLEPLLPFDLNALNGQLNLQLEASKFAQTQPEASLTAGLEQTQLALNLSSGAVKPVLKLTQLSNQSAQIRFEQFQTDAQQEVATNQTTEQPKAQSPDQPLLPALPFDLKFPQVVLNNMDIDAKLPAQTVAIKQMNIKVSEIQLNSQAKRWQDLLSLRLESQIEQLAASPYQLNQIVWDSRLSADEFSLDSLRLQTFDGDLSLAAKSSLTAPYQLTLENLVAQNMDVKLALPQPAEQADTVTEAAQESSEELSSEDSQQKTANVEAENPLQIIEFAEIKKVHLENIRFLARDPETQSVWLSAQPIHFYTQELRFIEAGELKQLKDLRVGTTLGLDIAKFNFKQTQLSEIKVNANSIDSGIHLTDASVILDQGSALVNGDIIQQGKLIKLKLSSNIHQFNLDKIAPLMQESPITPQGMLNADFESDLTIDQKAQLPAGINGEFVMKTDGFSLKGLALDKILDGFKASQETSLFDIGTFLVTGPVGMVAMQFVQLGSGAMQLKGDTQVQEIELHGDINNSQIMIENTRVKTKDNHLGFYGGIDLVNQAFKEFKFGLLEDNGCAPVQQTLDGSFSKIRDVLFNTTGGAVTSPLSSVLRTASDVASGGCKPFFAK